MEKRTNILPIGYLLQDGRYRVVQHLGSGGFGNTYRVVDTASEVNYALKEFFLRGVNERDTDSQQVSVSNADNRDEFEAQKSKFRKEATRLQQLDNPHVVHVFSLFEENGTAYYLMDYLNGASLSERLKQQGHPFSEDEVIGFADQILNALEVVHSKNIWHLDLKPGNIIAVDDGRLVLIDFGASKQFHDAEGYSLSTSTGLCYTPGYAPTEQISGETKRMGAWTDLYALGATLYNLMTGETPPSVSAIQDGGAFHFPPSTSEGTRHLITWLMEPNRNERPQTVAEVRKFMAATFHPDDSPTVVSNPQQLNDDDDEYEETAGRRRKVWYIVGGVLAAAIIAALILLLGKGSDKHRYDDDDDEEELADADMEDADEDNAERDSLEMIAALEQERQQALEEERIRQAEREAQQQAERERQRQEADRATQERQRQDAERAAQERQRQEADRAAQERQRQEADRAAQQSPSRQESDNRVYDVVENQPAFPGGLTALMQFLANNIQYPAVAEENGIQGKVVCTFVVETDGSISNVTVVRSVDPSLDKEAVRVLRSMPRWTPGTQDGRPVRVKYNIPVTFRLN
ncbi:MAG: TonB family protein [Prevotella sp.]|nr:TonB family protein [Prevotella sp.]